MPWTAQGLNPGPSGHWGERGVGSGEVCVENTVSKKKLKTRIYYIFMRGEKALYCNSWNKQTEEENNSNNIDRIYNTRYYITIIYLIIKKIVQLLLHFNTFNG